MTIFIDASALVAIIMGEPEEASLIAVIETHDRRLTSGPAMWETVRAVAKAAGGKVDAAERLCNGFRRRFGLQLVPFTDAELTEAVRAHARYGKGTGHPAKLNMGDCLAYACAKTNEATLIYKGDDFTHTDMA